MVVSIVPPSVSRLGIIRFDFYLQDAAGQATSNC